MTVLQMLPSLHLRFQNDLRHGPDGAGVEEGLWVYRGSWQQDSRYDADRCWHMPFC